MLPNLLATPSPRKTSSGSRSTLAPRRSLSWCCGSATCNGTSASTERNAPRPSRSSRTFPGPARSPNRSAPSSKSSQVACPARPPGHRPRLQGQTRRSRGHHQFVRRARKRQMPRRRIEHAQAVEGEVGALHAGWLVRESTAEGLHIIGARSPSCWKMALQAHA